MKHIAVAVALLCSILAFERVFADDATARKELMPTGKLRVGIAVGPIPGAGNVAMDASGQPRGIGADLARELGKKLGAQVEWVSYPNSGALTDAVTSGAWDVAFIPVDEQRKQKVDFGAAHLVLQSTFLVGPGSKIQTLEDVDKAGVRAAGVENTASGRAAQRSLKNVTMSWVKTAEELFDLLKTGKVDAISQSRESLTQMAAKLPGARVLPGAYLNSYIAVALPKNKPTALSYASAFIEDAKASGMVRRYLDNLGMQSSTVAPAGVKP